MVNYVDFFARHWEEADEHSYWTGERERSKNGQNQVQGCQENAHTSHDDANHACLPGDIYKSLKQIDSLIDIVFEVSLHWNATLYFVRLLGFIGLCALRLCDSKIQYLY